MGKWLIEARKPGAGNPWTDIASFANLRFRKEINTMGWADFSAYYATPSKTSLQAYWNLEFLTSDGKAEDLGPNGYHGAITGASDAVGKYGRGRSFTGTNNISVADTSALNFGTNPFTISWWGKTSSATNQTTLSKYNNPGGYEVGIENAGRGMFIGRWSTTDHAVYSTATGLADGNWHHVAVVVPRSGDKVQFYVDGALSGEPTISGLDAASLSNTAVGPTIGRNSWFPNQWIGTLDEVYVYTRALTLAEVQDVMNAAAYAHLRKDMEVRVRYELANTASLGLHWDMHRLTSAGLISDLSGSGNNGTIYNTVTETAGKWGRAKDFAGPSGNCRVESGTMTAPGFATIAGWFKLDTNNNYQRFISYGKTSATDYIILLSSDSTATPPYRITLQTKNGGGAVESLQTSVTPPLNQWFHLATVLNGTSTKIYIDGEEKASGTINDTAGFNAAFAVGDEPSGTSGSGIDGKADEIYMWLRVLAQDEIRDLMRRSEHFRGRIRNVNDDPLSADTKVYALGSGVVLYDRTWPGRRQFPGVPLNITIDEVANSPVMEPTTDLRMYWDLETRSDTSPLSVSSKDLTGNGFDGVATTDTLTGVAGKWGTAYYFRGADADGVIAGAGLGTILGGAVVMTAACYVKVDTHDGTSGETIFGNQFGNFRIAVLPSRAVRFFVTFTDVTTLQADTTITLSDDVWYHLALTWDGTNLKGYIDGAQAASNNAASKTLRTTGISGLSYGGVVGALFAGTADEACIYKRALSATEILMLAGRSIMPGHVGQMDTLATAGFRSEEERRLLTIDAIARTAGGEWYVDQDGYDKDRINVVSRLGWDPETDSFQFGSTAALADRKSDSETLYNDITVLGAGDAANQIKSRNFHATVKRTTLASDYGEAATGYLEVNDASSFPSSGVVYIGSERVYYNGTDTTTTPDRIGTTSVTRAYTTDGYDSLAAYTHYDGAELYVHYNGATSTWYTPEGPETGSSIAINGWRQGIDSRVEIIEQTAADLLAQRLNARYRTERTSLIVDAYEDSVTADVGDDVNVLDLLGIAYEDSPYRIVAEEFAWNERRWRLELSNYRDTLDRRLAELGEKMKMMGAYGQGSTNAYALTSDMEIEGEDPQTTGGESSLCFDVVIPSESVAINEITITRLRPKYFRMLHGGSDSANTGVASTATHSHTLDRPSHTHTPASVALTSTSTYGAYNPYTENAHSHTVTFASHGHGASGAHDPSAITTSGSAGGLGHNHTASLGLHGHSAPAAASAGASIGTADGHTHTVANDSHDGPGITDYDQGNVTSSNSVATGSHSHTVDPPSHTHTTSNSAAGTGQTGYTQAHRHGIPFSAHNHTNSGATDEGATTTSTDDEAGHSHSMPHTHAADLRAQTYSSPSLNVKIKDPSGTWTNPTSALGGPWTGTTSDIRLKDYFTKTGTYTVYVYDGTTGKLGRVQATLFVKCFVRAF